MYLINETQTFSLYETVQVIRSFSLLIIDTQEKP